MRTMFLIAAMCAGCVASRSDGAGATVQAVAGPGGVTATVRGAGELAVNWSADPAASQYQVFQSVAGGPLAFAGSVFGGGGTPSTSYIADALSGGVLYCYAIQSAYADGTMSAVGTSGCGTATAAGRTSTTIIIPIGPPLNARAVNLNANGMANVIAGNVNDPDNGFVEYIPLQLPVGTRIAGWRVRVQDSLFGGGSSRIASRLMFTTDNAHVPTAIATSSLSSGVGAEETISGSASVVSAAATQYWISVFDQVGTSTGFVRRLEVDVN